MTSPKILVKVRKAYYMHFKHISAFYLGATSGTFVSGPIALIRGSRGVSPLQAGQSR